MRSFRKLIAASLAVVTPAGSGVTQIRTPIATPLNTTPGPAPSNVKAVATNTSSAALSWDVAAGARYLIERRQADNPSCCVAQSGYLTTGSWQDGGLLPGTQYTFAITALYADGRSGTTEVMAATPFPQLSMGAVAFTPCTQRMSAGPDPGPIKWTSPQSPGGAFLTWNSPSPTGTNYIIDRAPTGTTTWTFVGSTCGGPSPVTVEAVDPSTGKNGVYVRDLAGGVRPGYSYTYRITRIGPSGEVGWQTSAWYAPCMKPPQPTATVSGSTVTVSWSSYAIQSCNHTSTQPETYTLTSSFGYVKTHTAYGFTKDVIYGVPLGTHTFYLVAGWRPDITSQALSTTATVAY